MMKSFDSHGWLSLADIPERQASIDAPDVQGIPVVGEPWPNWTGIEWLMIPFAPPQPTAPTVPGYGSKITTDALYRRMTPAERRRIELASIDPGIAGAARDLAADLRIGKARLSGATYFDLELPENIATINGMALAGLLDSPQHGGVTRAAEILNSPVTDANELPGPVRTAYGLVEIPI